MAKESSRSAEDTVTVQRPMDEAYERCLSSTDAFKRAKIAEADEANRSIEIKVGVSFKSWGEKVRIDLTPDGDSATRVKVSSKPSLGTTMVDYGKNQDNVNRVVSWVQG